MNDEDYMRIALEEARKAEARDEVPIGAVIVHNESGKILAQNGNRTLEHKDPTSHAEILVIRKACKDIGAQRIPDCSLFVTLEPCTMCSAAISFSRISKLIYGAYDPKGGAVSSGVQFFNQPTCHHKIEVVSGVSENASVDLLKRFFQSKRS